MARSSSKDKKTGPALPTIKQIRERLRASFPTETGVTGASADPTAPGDDLVAAQRAAAPDSLANFATSSEDAPSPEVQILGDVDDERAAVPENEVKDALGSAEQEPCPIPVPGC